MAHFADRAGMVCYNASWEVATPWSGDLRRDQRLLQGVDLLGLWANKI